MRVLALAAICAVALAGSVTSAHAGKIFGDISFGGKPVPAGLKVSVTAPGGKAVADTTTTDKFGSYKLTVKEEGKSILRVVYEKTPLEFALFSNKEATRYDLVIEKKEGKFTIRRK